MEWRKFLKNRSCRVNSTTFYFAKIYTVTINIIRRDRDMDMKLSNIEPKEVFKYFEEISSIPRGSGNEKKISDYLVKFAKEHNLEVIQDEFLNVIIKKPGTKGYEDASTVIIQGHMDMVCEKNKDTEFDFTKDSLKLIVDGDYVKTEGTTLGADDGIAMAMAMAILSSNEIPHPPLKVLITTEEEVGLNGATALKSDFV